VLTSKGHRSADLEIRNIRVAKVAQQIDLLVDVNLRHDFIGAGQTGLTQGQLCNPDNPDHILQCAAADQIRNFVTHIAATGTWLSCWRAGLLQTASTASLRLIFFLSNKQADDCSAALGYQPHRQEFCHRRGVFFQQNRCTGHVLRRCVAPQPPRIATSLHTDGVPGPRSPEGAVWR
jgi:hypothetical protein